MNRPRPAIAGLLPLCIAVSLMACSSSKQTAEKPRVRPSTPVAAPSVSASPTIDPARKAACQSDEDFLVAQIGAYFAANTKLDGSTKDADFVTFAGTVGRILDAVKKRPVDPAFEAERKDLITGLTDVRTGDLEGVYATSTAIYNQGLALAKKGYKMILLVDGLISPDFFQCVGLY